MKKEALLLTTLFFILLVPFSYAQDWMYNSEALTLGLKISSSMKLAPTSNNYKILYIMANLSLFPREDSSQRVRYITTEPEAQKYSDSILFTWERPAGKNFDFAINSEVETLNEVKKVKQKITFPLKDLPEDYSIYTKPTKNIDSDNQEIINLASKLVEGQDDLYVVVSTIGQWVESNIEYSLTTLTASVSQPASWVLENRYGVCDEITTLFIALLRPLGIPARVVEGVAYTNFQDLNDWGPHAWAEVYFPGVGWVPFDITYNELGYIDPTHIILKYSLDPEEASTSYGWQGTNVDLVPKPLEIKASLLGQGTALYPALSVRVNVLKDKIGFGSHNLVEVTLKNLADYYLTTNIYMVNVNEVEIIGGNKKNVLLKPNQEKKIFWVIKLSNKLDSRYIYTIPIGVYTQGNVTAKTSFESTSGDKVYSREYVERILLQKQELEEKAYSRELSLECKSDKDAYYLNDKAFVACYIKNQGNAILESLNVCFEENCRKIDLAISQEKRVDFEIEINDEDKTEFFVSAANPDVKKTISLPLNVLDKPRIDIAEIKAPGSVGYTDSFDVSFRIEKVSRAVPKNLNLVIERKGVPNGVAYIEKLAANQEIVFHMTGKSLGAGENNLIIVAQFEDDRGGKYNFEKEFKITLANLTTGQKIAIFFKEAFRSVAGIFG